MIDINWAEYEVAGPDGPVVRRCEFDGPLVMDRDRDTVEAVLDRMIEAGTARLL